MNPVSEDSTQVRRHDQAVSGMFGRIAGWYDVCNRVLSLGIDRYWRRVLADNVRLGPTGRVLDLAAGTLDVSLAIRRRYPDARIPALDFCLPMLQRGARKLRGWDAAAILPVAADAKKLPLPDASVDCVTIAFGIRNITPRDEAFREMLRVLTPGGRACILEFGSGRERIWGGLYNFYLGRILPRIGRLFSGDNAAYGYLADTINAFPSALTLERELTDAGFARAWHRKLTSGIVCLHVAEKAR
ncbi:ubiquinone/menaquinone biosynthesis methyltransferase [Desulfovibrio sp.]|uniref:ubiquinone/menaquinone biosynthesis methyltransferase n=1 Tax=Desulfovibrio sp. TaxID=885 RepID=UPI0025C6EC25|nr:ubiquinone/menaquinone biosynthesis methyltransferase [Desulfovibrio sp.]